jgi:hypothetical protein
MKLRGLDPSEGIAGYVERKPARNNAVPDERKVEARELYE